MGERKEIQAAEDEEDTSDLPAQVEQYVNTIVDPPPYATEELAHVPGQDMSHAERRLDWPPTPLSPTGLTEGVRQRIEWLAHRIPHGHHTPMQLAEWYSNGHLTLFESDEEKEKVLALASKLVREKADEEFEKTNKVVEPDDMTFDDVVSRKPDRDGLVSRYVQGRYPVVAKQKMPFLDQIVRNLNNNATYPSAKTDVFMDTVQKLMRSQAPAPGTPGPQRATKAKAA